MRLGGWWRLWLVATGLYGVLVAIVFWQAWRSPTLEGIAHQESFKFRMSNEAQAVLNQPVDVLAIMSMQQLKDGLAFAMSEGDQESRRAFETEIEERRTKPWSRAPIILEMPNGFEFSVNGNTPKADMTLIGREYTRVLREVLQQENSERRKSHIREGLAVWLIPALTVCALGLLARWVYNGFEKNRPTRQ